jgi:hypothetical protein
MARVEIFPDMPATPGRPNVRLLIRQVLDALAAALGPPFMTTLREDRYAIGFAGRTPAAVRAGVERLLARVPDQCRMHAGIVMLNRLASSESLLERGELELEAARQGGSSPIRGEPGSEGDWKIDELWS